MGSAKETLGNFLIKHGPKILTAIGIGSLVGCVAVTIKSTPKAMQKVEELKEEKREQQDSNPEETAIILSKKEIVRATWRCYIPTIATGIGSVFCFVFAESIYWKQATAIAATLEVAKSSLQEYKHYKDAVIEEVGEEVEEKIRGKVAQKKIDEVEKPEPNDPIYILSDDEVIFYLDLYDGGKKQCFKSTMNKVGETFNHINESMLCNFEASENDICEAFGVKCIRHGDNYGWRPEVTGLIQWHAHPVNIDGFHPGFCIEFLTKPIDFRKFII